MLKKNIVLNYMFKFIGHFKTITMHKIFVTLFCFKSGLYIQGLKHDLSKYNPGEFFGSVKYYNGIQSPIDLEKAHKGFSYIGLYHTRANKHHFEYWVGFLDDKTIVPHKIPIKYIYEMVCDSIAAGKIYMGNNWNDSSPLEFFTKVYPNRYYNKDSSDLLFRIFHDIKKFGYKKILKHMRNKYYDYN